MTSFFQYRESGFETGERRPARGAGRFDEETVGRGWVSLDRVDERTWP